MGMIQLQEYRKRSLQRSEHNERHFQGSKNTPMQTHVYTSEGMVLAAIRSRSYCNLYMYIRLHSLRRCKCQENWSLHGGETVSSMLPLVTIAHDAPLPQCFWQSSRDTRGLSIPVCFIIHCFWRETYSSRQHAFTQLWNNATSRSFWIHMRQCDSHSTSYSLHTFALFARSLQTLRKGE